MSPHVVRRITAIATIALSTAAATVHAQPTTAVAPDDPGARYVVGTLGDDIPESSGIVASRKHAGVFWTLNDSGNPPRLFAVDRGGRTLAAYDVLIKNVDWEDIATDDAGHLYIAEVGNNARRKDRQPAVYRVDEPDPSLPVPPDALKVNARFGLRYPGEPFDCEALFTWRDHGYVISKQRDGGRAQMFRFPLVERPLPIPLQPVATLPLRAPVTAADMSADGKELLVLTVFGPNRYVVDGDPARAETVVPRSVPFLQPDMEAGTLVPNGVLATTESQHVLLFTDDDFTKPRAAAERPAARATVARAARPVTVDGDLADWDVDACRQPFKYDGPGDVPVAARAADLLLAWRPEGLSVATRVPRADPSPLVTEWFAGDVVEFFFGPDAPGRAPEYGPGDDRCYAGFAPLADGTRGPVALHWPRRDAGRGPGAAAGRVGDDGTYAIEAFLPAPVLVGRDALKPGDTFRLNVSAIAKAPRRNWYLSEPNNAGAWMTPVKWAVVTLE